MNKETLYKETYGALRATDEISFKLIGLVPLATLLGFIGAFIKEIKEWSPWFYSLGVIGSLLVFGIFRWELRNIQKCKRYCDIIDQLEEESEIGDLQKKEKPKLLKMTIGKTEAEKLIYSTLVVAWLTLPFLLRASVPEKLSFGFVDYSYVGFCFAMLLLTATSVFSKKDL